MANPYPPISESGSSSNWLKPDNFRITTNKAQLDVVEAVSGRQSESSPFHDQKQELARMNRGLGMEPP